MGETPSGRARVLRWVAAIPVVMAAASIVLTVGSLFATDNDITVLLGVPPLVALAYVAWLPFLGDGERFRRRSAIAGWILLVAGVLLVVFYVGVLLVPLAFVYLAAAYLPDDWAAPWVLALGLAPTAVILLTVHT